MTEPQRCTCLVCDRRPHIRGLCPRCYSEARAAIADDLTTEEELIQRGLMAPKRTRRKIGPLMAALQSRRSGEVTSLEGQRLLVGGEAAKESSESYTYICVAGCDVTD